jgi:conjugal transfer mating pair stabilization protein TraN
VSDTACIATGPESAPRAAGRGSSTVYRSRHRVLGVVAPFTCQRITQASDCSDLENGEMHVPA